MEYVIISEKQKKLLDIVVLILSGISAGLSIYAFFERQKRAERDRLLLEEIRDLVKQKG